MNDIIEVKDLKFPPIEYGVTETALIELAERYKDPDASTEEGYERCKEGVKELTSLRTAVETRRKDLKAPALGWGRDVDRIAKNLVNRIKKIEGPVRSAKDVVDSAKQLKARAAAEAEQQRIDTIRENIAKIEFTAREQHPSDTASDYQTHITWLTELAITEEVFGEFVEDAKTSRDASLYKLEQWYQLALEREEADKKRAEEQTELEVKQKELEAALKKQREEADRLEKEKRDAEARKAEEEKAAQEKADREQREKTVAEERRIAAIDDRIDELRTFGEFVNGLAALRDTILTLDGRQLDAEHFAEKLEQAVAVKIDRLAELKRRLVEAEKVEEQQRLEEAAKMPDRDKLSNWFNALVTASACPEVGSKDAQKIVNRYGAELAKLTDNLRKAIAKL